MTERTGNISVRTQDVLPIIKKWLYSEHDIFLRELVANATDAIVKRETVCRTQNKEIPAGEITIELDKENKFIRISDNGIGMSEQEVEKYLAQLAFSGAEEFVEKMKAEGTESGNDIIGKFGLGFYSSFMVADEVVVDSLSVEDGAKPTRWICRGEEEYTFTESDRAEVGTTITLKVGEHGSEFLDYWKLSDTLKNHCRFMPFPIALADLDKEREEEKKKPEERTEMNKGPVNNTNPLWKRDPKELKEEDYKTFFRELFPMDPEPLFWLHLKVDHPFTLDGILYFPKINPNRPFNESNIFLYSKQVFVSDNVKNIIPDFLSLLKGVIDSVDIPLNVSRSSLQGDPNIRKISNYVVKKVAEALKKLFKNDRPKYEGIWEDAGIFVKYGCISDTKFDELMRSMVIFKNTAEKYVTLTEYREGLPADYREKIGNNVLYYEKDKANHSLNAQLAEQKIHAVGIDDHIDPHFMQHVEFKKQGEEEYKFVSVSSEIENILETENSTEEDMKIKDLYQEILVGKEDPKDEEKEDEAPAFDAKMGVEIRKIKNSQAPAYFKVDEQMKRYQHMAKSMGQDQVFPLKKTLVINPNSPIIQNSLKLWENGDNKDLVEKIAHHVQDLAHISQEGLQQDEKDQFVKRTQELLQELTGRMV